MRTSHWLVSAMGALALGFLAMPAQAAPTGAVTGNTVATQEAESVVDQVRHRCYRHRGHWHCPRHRRHGYYGYGYAPYYYYNPGFSLYIGRGWGHRHHRRWH